MPILEQRKAALKHMEELRKAKLEEKKFEDKDYL